MFSSISFRLHTDKEHKTYDNMQDWWVNQAKCSSNYIISQDDMIQKICTKFICICTYLVFSLSGCEFILMLLKIFRNQILPLFEIHFICTRYLREHLKIFTKVTNIYIDINHKVHKNYKCDSCGKSFIVANTIRVHMICNKKSV